MSEHKIELYPSRQFKQQARARAGRRRTVPQPARGDGFPDGQALVCLRRSGGTGRIARIGRSHPPALSVAVAGLAGAVGGAAERQRRASALGRNRGRGQSHHPRLGRGAFRPLDGQGQVHGQRGDRTQPLSGSARVTAVESDMGEYIVQLAGEKPTHIIMPAIHKTKADIARLFTTSCRIRPTPRTWTS